MTSLGSGSALAALSLVVGDGSRSDPVGQAGLTSLTANLLQEGTKTLSAEEIARRVDFLGATLAAETGFDFSLLALSVMSKDLEEGLAIFAEVILSPSFPDKEVNRERREMLGALEAERQDPGKVAERAYLAALYGPDHPYGHPPQGSEEGVKGLTRKEVLAHYRRHCLPNNAILIAVGDFQGDDLLARLEKAFGGWKKGELPSVEPSPLTPPAKGRVLLDEPVRQANIIVGRRAIARSDPDFYSLQVGNYILGGGGFASRLMEQVRSRRGLAYNVASDLTALAWPGSLDIVVGTANATAGEAIELVGQQMERMAQEEVSAEELRGAKQYLIGSFPLKLDSNRKLARYFAAVSFYGLGLDYAQRYPGLIEAQTPATIRSAWQRRIAPNEPTTVVVANLKEAGLKEQ